MAKSTFVFVSWCKFLTDRSACICDPIIELFITIEGIQTRKMDLFCGLREPISVELNQARIIAARWNLFSSLSITMNALNLKMIPAEIAIWFNFKRGRRKQHSHQKRIQLNRRLSSSETAFEVRSQTVEWWVVQVFIEANKLHLKKTIRSKERTLHIRFDAINSITFVQFISDSCAMRTCASTSGSESLSAELGKVGVVIQSEDDVK